MAKITKGTLHAGHNAPGKIACGASDYIDESKEARTICKMTMKLLKKAKLKFKNCTVNNGKSQIDVLKKILAKINKAIRSFAKVGGAALNVSLHFNASSHQKKDGVTTGVEAIIKPVPGDDDNYTKTKKTMKYKVAKAMCLNISLLGFRNRGVKFRDDLFILNQTNEQTVLLEICFVTDPDDAQLYKKKKKQIAQAIANAIIMYD